MPEAELMGQQYEQDRSTIMLYHLLCLIKSVAFTLWNSSDVKKIPLFLNVIIVFRLNHIRIQLYSASYQNVLGFISFTEYLAK